MESPKPRPDTRPAKIIHRGNGEGIYSGSNGPIGDSTFGTYLIRSPIISQYKSDSLFFRYLGAAGGLSVPVIEVNGNKVIVKVGEVAHPMAEDHYIEWIALETKAGNQRHILKPGDKPETVFAIEEGDDVVGAYAYCNKHGLWLKENH